MLAGRLAKPRQRFLYPLLLLKLQVLFTVQIQPAFIYVSSDNSKKRVGIGVWNLKLNLWRQTEREETERKKT